MFSFNRDDGRNGSGLPILIANGWAPFPLPLNLVQRQYRKLGFPSRVVPFSLDDNRNIEDFADHVAEWVPRFCIEHGVRKINLMGISLGGVAGMLALKRKNIARYVAVFACVGAPLLGSPLWVLAAPSVVFSKLGRQLRPYNSFLTKLAREPLPPDVPVIAVAGTRDHTCPVWSASVPGARNIILPFGHGAVLGSSTIPPVVAPFLARHPP